MASSSSLSLYVTGIRKIVIKQNCNPEATLRRESQKKKNCDTSKTKMKVRSEISQDNESQSTELSCCVTDLQPSMWVSIVQKVSVLRVTKNETKRSAYKLRSTWVPTTVRQKLLPEGFKDYLQKNFSLIAEVETAKRMRSDNRHILRTQETEENWTSHAPRPAGWPSTEHKKVKNRLKRKKNSGLLNLPKGVQGVHKESVQRHGPQQKSREKLIRKTKTTQKLILHVTAEKQFNLIGESPNNRTVNQKRKRNKKKKKKVSFRGTYLRRSNR